MREKTDCSRPRSAFTASEKPIRVVAEVGRHEEEVVVEEVMVVVEEEEVDKVEEMFDEAEEGVEEKRVKKALDSRVVTIAACEASSP